MKSYSWLNLGNRIFEFERLKSNRQWRFVYANQRLFTLLLGKKRFLRSIVMLHWYLKRLCWEGIQEIIGNYENISVMGATKDFLDEEVSPGVSVVDLGCSTGHWSRYAKSLGAEVFGVDHNESSIEIAKLLDPSIHFEASTIENFFLKNSRFYDLAILTHILEHLDSPEQLLAILRTRTNKLIVEVPDIESDPLNFARLTLGLPFYTDSDHVREYSSQTLEQLLRSQKYKIVKTVKRGGTIAVIAKS